MKVIPITLPTPFIVGDVNVYLIDAKPLTLVDTGPKTAEALNALREGLSRAGYKISDIRRLFLTHAHEDHCGLAETIGNEAETLEILIHGWETGHIFGRVESDSITKLLYRAGIPDDVTRKIKSYYDYYRDFTDVLNRADFKQIRDGEELEFETGAWRILHTPGHTPGSCSLLREADRTIIAGDCVLKRITPNPILSPDPVNPERRFPSLAEQLVSLAKIRSCAPTLIYGGHGEPVTDYEELFHRTVRAADERQAKILSLVGKSGITAFDAAQKLFPHLTDKDSQIFLAVSEAVAHLDYAVSNGKLAIETKEGIEFYRK